MNEVGGPIQRIDTPDVLGVGVLAAAFLGEDAVLGEGLVEGVDDHALGCQIGRGHQIARRRLGVHRVGVEAVEVPHQLGPRGARDLFGRAQDLG